MKNVSHMYKKHELIIGLIFEAIFLGSIFRHIRIFWKKLRQPSNLNGKNNFLSSQAYQMMLKPVRDVFETALLILHYFFVMSTSAKYEVWKISKDGK